MWDVWDLSRTCLISAGTTYPSYFSTSSNFSALFNLGKTPIIYSIAFQSFPSKLQAPRSTAVPVLRWNGFWAVLFYMSNEHITPPSTTMSTSLTNHAMPCHVIYLPSPKFGQRPYEHNRNHCHYHILAVLPARPKPSGNPQENHAEITAISPSSSILPQPQPNPHSHLSCFSGVPKPGRRPWSVKKTWM